MSQALHDRHDRDQQAIGDLDELRTLARHIRIDALGDELNDLLGQIDQALNGLSSIIPRLVELAHTVEPPEPAARSRHRC